MLLFVVAVKPREVNSCEITGRHISILDAFVAYLLHLFFSVLFFHK
jgi:hypothetical protein